MKKLVISAICIIISFVIIIGSVVIIGANKTPKVKEKTIYVEVVQNENTASYMLKTEEIYLLGALDNNGFIETEKSELGVELTCIDGLRKKTDEHFELFVNDIREAKSIDRVLIENNATYKFTLAK